MTLPEYEDYKPEDLSIRTFFIFLDALNIQYLISSNGGLATKSSVESVLMKRHKIDRATAHDVLNQIEFHNINCRAAPISPPLLSNYPEIFQVRIEQLTAKRNYK